MRDVQMEVTMCMVDYADEMCEVLQSGFRKARKSHKCNECRREIKPAELYRYEYIKFDGELDSHKTCPQCLVVRYWLEKECSGWVYGGIEEDLVEHAQEGHLYPSPHWMSIARMAVGIRNRWENGKMPRLALLTDEGKDCPTWQPKTT